MIHGELQQNQVDMSQEPSKGKKRAHRPSIAVQCLNPTAAPAVTRSNKCVHSDAAWMDKDDKKNALCFQNYLDYAPKIVLPLTLCSLQKPLTADEKKELEEKTERLAAQSHPARCTSAQYVNRNGEPLLYYFGRRLVHAEDRKNVTVSAKTQYSSQSVEDMEIVAKQDRSAILDIKCNNYQLAAQSLSMDTKLQLFFDEARHEGKNVMDYETPCLGSTLDADVSLSNMLISEGAESKDGNRDQYKADPFSFKICGDCKGNPPSPY